MNLGPESGKRMRVSTRAAGVPACEFARRPVPRLSVRRDAAGIRRRDGRATAGFTLMELMIVIVIIGIMTAMILPEMRGTFEDALLRSTSRQLVGAFDLAASRSITLNQIHRVRLDTETGKYQLERRVRSGGFEEFVPVDDVSGCSGTLDKRIAIEVHRPEDTTTEVVATAQVPAPTEDLTEGISFYADGTSDAALITLQDREGFRLSLRLNPITSRVQVMEVDRQ